jgi:hypothetical protein
MTDDNSHSTDNAFETPAANDNFEVVGDSIHPRNHRHCPTRTFRSLGKSTRGAKRKLRPLRQRNASIEDRLRLCSEQMQGWTVVDAYFEHALVEDSLWREGTDPRIVCQLPVGRGITR